MKKLIIIALSHICASHTTLDAIQSPRYNRFQEYLSSQNPNPQSEDIDNVTAIVDDLDELKTIYPTGEKLPLTALDFLADYCEYPNITEITALYYKTHGFDRDELVDSRVRTSMRISGLKRKWDKSPDTSTKNNIFQCQTFYKFLEALRPNR